MASIVKGYEYDIFISYRQKDNKYDGWVTEFVDNLKRELEATFKEEVSVYFDINPHDGLLETHDVDASLKEKLKCLVFIPIISQTYCDPKSFAWEHEFRAFIEQVSRDQFGLKVKLHNGNVANRILPIQIHDLDSEDKALLENELGGVLRSIEFIYKSSGVNRPLRSNEEHPDENINHIIYRDQINKVANAIKEILYSMVSPQKAGSEKVIPIASKTPETKPVAVRKNIQNRTLIGLIVIILIFLVFGTKSLVGKHKLPNSIIVLPFSTQDSSQTYFAEGIAVDLITELAKVKNISTLSWNTSASYARTTKPLKEIASETGVSYILTGIIQRDKQNIRVNVTLVSPETGKSLWAQSWDQELKFVFDIQKQIAKDVARELGVKLSSEEHAKLDRYSIRNFEAYDLFLKARAESRKFVYNPIFLHRSNKLLEEALKIDPNFPQALTLRATNLIDLTWTEGLDPEEEGFKIREDLNKSLDLDPNYSDAYLALGGENYFIEWNFREARKNFEKGWELSNYGEVPTAQCFCGFVEFTMITGDYLKVLSLVNQIEKRDPGYPYAVNEKILTYAILQDRASIRKIITESSHLDADIAIAHYELGNYDEAIKGFLAEGTSNIMYSGYLASAYYKSGMVEKSDSIVNQLIIRSKNERNIDFGLARIFAVRGDKEKALAWYKSAYAKHDLWIVNTLMFTDLKSIINESEVQKILKEIGIINEPAGG
jgi:TolB-like protein